MKKLIIYGLLSTIMLGVTLVSVISITPSTMLLYVIIVVIAYPISLLFARKAIRAHNEYFDDSYEAGRLHRMVCSAITAEEVEGKASYTVIRNENGDVTEISISNQISQPASKFTKNHPYTGNDAIINKNMCEHLGEVICKGEQIKLHSSADNTWRECYMDEDGNNWYPWMLNCIVPPQN